MAKELTDHFDAVMSSYHDDFHDAIADQLASTREVQRQHTKRLNRLETHTGLTA